MVSFFILHAHHKQPKCINWAGLSAVRVLVQQWLGYNRTWCNPRKRCGGFAGRLQSANKIVCRYVPGTRAVFHLVDVRKYLSSFFERGRVRAAILQFYFPQTNTLFARVFLWRNFPETKAIDYSSIYQAEISTSSYAWRKKKERDSLVCTWVRGWWLVLSRIDVVPTTYVYVIAHTMVPGMSIPIPLRTSTIVGYNWKVYTWTR